MNHALRAIVMAKLRSVTISSLQDFTESIESLPEEQIHWYRGCGKASDKLVPTLYRHLQKPPIDKLVQIEKELLSWFKDRSVPYQPREPRGAWEYLFFMQHFRVPTRLLDWTENPFIALYFALTSERPADRKPSAAVWVLEPERWNQWAFEENIRQESYAPRIPSADDDRLLRYDPLRPAHLAERSVAMFGTHTSLLMAAQRGTFVVFGKDRTPMEEIYSDDNFPPGVLVKLVIPAKSRASLLNSLLTVGITDSVVFPDLDHLAMEARRHFGFEV